MEVALAVLGNEGRLPGPVLTSTTSPLLLPTIAIVFARFRNGISSFDTKPEPH